ncbi:MAG: hypothetical protein ABL995_04855 [Bryobacteraceae bacterium]
MSTAVEVLMPAAITSAEVVAGARELSAPRLNAPIRVLNVPWRDPQTVSKAELAVHIQSLETACAANPTSADLRTCLGMAYAMNFQAYKSMAALEQAVELDGTHFFAQLKLSELFYRLRALPKAEEETLKAVHLAGNAWELSLARKQLKEIRRLICEGTQKPEWNKSLRAPAILFAIMTVALCIVKVVTR